MNNVTGRIVLLTLAGIAAGFLTWFLSDLSGLIHIPDTSGALTQRETVDQAIVCSFFGAMIGLLLGVADMVASGTQAQWMRIVGYGLAIGAVAGFVGLNFGMQFYILLHVEKVTNPIAFLLNTIARAIGWAFIGALAGCADGVRKWSPRVIRNGVIGGFIGGLLGGTVFEAAVYIFVGVPRPAVISRMLGFLITGALIGLFIGLVQQLLKEAWVRVVVGKNEGREVLIEKENTTIGRSELSDIGLFGDMSVSKQHALLRALPSGGYALRDVSDSEGLISVNEKRIQRGEDTPVKNGDTIRIGNKTLIFYERWTKERTASAPRDGQRPAPVAASVRPPIGTPATGPMAMTTPMAAPAAPTLASAVHGMSANGYGSSPAAAAVRLVAVSGPHTGQIFAAHSGAVIGRDASVEVAIPGDSSASRRHARLIQETLSFAVEDLGSTNGTYVNGQRVTRQSLVPGDTVKVGGTSFRLE